MSDPDLQLSPSQRPAPPPSDDPDGATQRSPVAPAVEAAVEAERTARVEGHPTVTAKVVERPKTAADGPDAEAERANTDLPPGAGGDKTDVGKSDTALFAGTSPGALPPAPELVRVEPVAVSEATAADDDWIGSVLEGRYEIEAKLGEGGIGRVYRARHLKLGRPVAVKVLLERFRGTEAVRARFEREAQTLSALQHPNIVTVTDYGVLQDPIAAGCPYLVMELVDGSDLDVLLEQGLIPIERAVGLMIQVLRSLAYAHESGIVHRDLKPGNALLRVLPDGSDHVEVLDFGLAKFLDEGTEASPASPKLTRAGTILGTPAYMAPEQVEAAACDARTDVYAAGVMLFELLTGVLPFQHQDPGTMLRAHLVDPPPSMRSKRPEVPAVLETIVEKALSKRMDARYADGGAMLEALEAVDLHERATVTGKLRAIGEDLPEKLEQVSSRVGGQLRTLEGRWGVLRKSAEKKWGETRTRLPAPMQKIPTSVYLFAAVALGVVVLAGALVAMMPTVSTVEVGPTPHAAITEIPDGVDLADVEQTDELPDARNPWLDVATLPPEIVSIKARVDSGRRLGRSQLGSLRMLHRDYPNDCRPLLLHAHGYALRRWLSHALPLYIEAFELDPSCRGDPAMLDNLVEMAATETLEREAASVILQIYGSEAEDAVEAAIESSSRAVERQRLEALLDAL